MDWIWYLLLALTAGMFGWTLWIRIASYRLRGRSASPLAAVIPALENHVGRAVVYCYTERCGLCRRLTPVIDRMREEYDNLHKLDLQAHPQLARELGILATPTTLLVENGRVSKAILGSEVPAVVAAYLQPQASR